MPLISPSSHFELPRPKTPIAPVVLVIMDGIGVADDAPHNAVTRAATPTFHKLRKRALYRELEAHGTAVGLPSDDDMGNSEVGHNAIGAGRVFAQGAKLVNQSIQSGELFLGSVWTELIGHVKQQNSALHFLGLLSDGNVHSHIDHLFHLLDQAAAAHVPRIYVHILLDGRDVPDGSALNYIDRLEEKLFSLRQHGCSAAIASGGGRMWITMDRYEADWDMVERGYRTHVLGEARGFPSARHAIETFRQEGAQNGKKTSDQFLPAFVVTEGTDPSAETPIGRMNNNDAVILFNFRGDRAIEISTVFENPSFARFKRPIRPSLFAGMMQYDGDLKIPKKYLVDPPQIDRTLGEYLANNGVRQFACSETQKYGHVTYFFNGNRSGKFKPDLETYLEIPSDNCVFSERPKMKAKEITDATIEALQSAQFAFLRINYANGDMVGHTGDLEAAIVAIEEVDTQLGRLWEAAERAGGSFLVTADHGNAEDMRRTSHTLNPVPFYATSFSDRIELSHLETAGLGNIASTVLELLGFEPPSDYLPSLIRRIA